jgi:hypothetical protein
MGTGYATLWNAFKRITAGCSHIDKLALYSGTAKRLYHRLRRAQLPNRIIRPNKSLDV